MKQAEFAHAKRVHDVKFSVLRWVHWVAMHPSGNDILLLLDGWMEM